MAITYSNTASGKIARTQLLKHGQNDSKLAVLILEAWKLGSASLLAMGYAITDFGDYALAQITPDGTLGGESSVVTPTNVNGSTW